MTDATRSLTSSQKQAFADAVFAYRKSLRESLSRADWQHLRRVIWFNRLLTVLGHATGWLLPNPLSAYLISQASFGRWMVMHHVSHGGYDKVPGAPARYHSKRFAMGRRRWLDWFDWILPEAWAREHNVLHHYYTSEIHDPDLVEDLSGYLRESRWPLPIKYLFVAIIAATWKFTYYAPNTLRVVYGADRGANAGLHRQGLIGAIWRDALDLRQRHVRMLWSRCWLPYGIFSFLLIPACFLVISPVAALNILLTRILAEIFTNLHTFLVIAPNHAGDDLCRYDGHFDGRADFVYRQVLSSCNYRCGTQTIDYLQGYLNYQIEHHLYPRIPMRPMPQIQVRVRELCAEHGVPYIQESVFTRLRQLMRIMTGQASMVRIDDEASEPDSALATAPGNRT